MVGKQELGPSPPAPSGRHISPVRMKVLALLNERGREGIVVAQAAERLGGHPNRARAHLDGLVADGLASSGADQPIGRGRPALRYWISASGRTLLEDEADADNQSLTRAFTEYLATQGDQATVRAVGQLWARSVPIANDAKAGENTAARLTALMSTANFNPAVDLDGRTIRLRTCPFVDQAHANQKGICGVHQWLVDGALEAWEFTGQAQLHPFSDPGACSLEVTEQAPNGTGHSAAD